MSWTARRGGSRAVSVAGLSESLCALFGTGESDWEIQCRAVKAVDKIIRRGPGQYLVIAHGGILNAALRHIVGASPPMNRHGVWFGLGDTGFARTTYHPTCPSRPGVAACAVPAASLLLQISGR